MYRRVLDATATVQSERQHMQMASLFLGTLDSFLAAAARADVDPAQEYSEVLPW